MTLSPDTSTAATSNPSTPTARDCALYYARLGWHVLPLKPGVKSPEGGLVANGVHDATTDAATVNGWFNTCPGAGVGVACGA